MDDKSRSESGLVSDILNADLSSRRSFLKRSAAAGAGTLALAVGSSNTALAHETDDELSDVDVLNFALTLEHLEYAFYRDGLEQFGCTEFRDSETLEGLSDRVTLEVEDNLADVRDHEETHVETLTSVINDLGGEPVEEATYDFGVSDADEFLAVAAVLENTGVSAYDGAINEIEDAELLTAGATIATVEARHASYLNLLNDEDPFPAAFDEAKSMEEIVDAISGFIVEN